jgi:NAD(P)-dependent dehydrogenase (short-subunit alcohol dehydrogenase family)
MEIDAVGTFTMCRAAFGALKASQAGVIINISATLHYGATWYQVCMCACVCMSMCVCVLAVCQLRTP